MGAPYLYGIIFSIGGVVFFLITLLFFAAYYQNKKTNYLILGWVFFFITIHELFNGLPVLLFPDELFFLSITHLIGKIGAFASLYASTFILARVALKQYPIVVRILQNMLIFGALLTVVLYIFTLPMPTITETVVLWNEHILSRVVSGLVFFVYGSIWGVAIYREAMRLPQGNTRFQTLALSFAGSGLAFAGFVGFTAGSSTQILAAIAIVAAVIVMSFFAFFIRA